jgi:hypothetical protein
MEINKPKGVKPKMRGGKVARGIKTKRRKTNRVQNKVLVL